MSKGVLGQKIQVGEVLSKKDCFSPKFCEFLGNESLGLVRASRVTCQALEMGWSGPKIKVVQKFPKKCGVILDMYS